MMTSPTANALLAEARERSLPRWQRKLKRCGRAAAQALVLTVFLVFAVLTVRIQQEAASSVQAAEAERWKAIAAQQGAIPGEPVQFIIEARTPAEFADKVKRIQQSLEIQRMAALAAGKGK